MSIKLAEMPTEDKIKRFYFDILVQCQWETLAGVVGFSTASSITMKR
jgi:hypothetical protein